MAKPWESGSACYLGEIRQAERLSGSQSPPLCGGLTSNSTHPTGQCHTRSSVRVRCWALCPIRSVCVCVGGGGGSLLGVGSLR